MKKHTYLKHKAAKDLKGNGGKWQLPLLIFLLLLLPVMAVIQYHYLSKLSDAEEVRLKTNLELMAKNFTNDFNNEWTKIQETFTFNGSSSIDFESRFNQAYLTWKDTASFPDLIKNIYLFELKNDKPVLSIFDIQKGTFSPSGWPDELGGGKNLPVSSAKSSNLFFFLPDISPSKKYPIIILPNRNREISDTINKTFPISHIIIIPNPDAAPDMLSTLLEKHFPVQNDFQLDIAITKGNGPDDVLYMSDPSLNVTDFHNAEVRTEIRRWAENSGIFIDVKPQPNSAELAKKEHSKPTIIDIHIVKNILPDKIDNISSINDLLGKIPAPHFVIWNLMVKIRDDTLEGIVDKTRKRNLLTSYCILLILGVSMVMVYVSAQRMGSLARRQLRFVYGVSHELRTPISVICSAGENLADGVITDMGQQKQYGRLIRDEGRRLSTMVENILSFSALQNGKTTLNLRAARIIDILEECINSRSESNDFPGPDIKIESHNNLPLVKVEYSSIKIALNNVIDNCIKYSPDNSPILIRIRHTSPNNQLIISFEDHGRGIDADDLPYLFDPFFRGKNTEEKRTPGSGIGLSLVNEIIHKHGGKIEVKSQRHKGTTVSIFLPVT